MGIKYLKGVAPNTNVTMLNFRPTGFDYPKGLKFSAPTDGIPFDMLIVGGGGCGRVNVPFGPGGAGGAGGYRLLTANNVDSFVSDPLYNTALNPGCTVIPVSVGAGGGGTSCFGTTGTPFHSSGGGTGGFAHQGGPAPGGSGGSGAGGGGGPNNPEFTGPWGAGGSGIAGQGFPGQTVTRGTGGAGGGAGGPGAPGTEGPGVPTSFTGSGITYSCGGPRTGKLGSANRGDGGGIGGCLGGSGVVAIRYCNPAAPTTPLAQGGDSIVCTGGCIIHVFNSSAFFNVIGSGTCID